MEPSPDERPGLLVLHEPGSEAFAAAVHARLADELVLAPLVLSAASLESDRAALAELDAALAALRARPEVDGERVAVLGFGRGGTLAFLLACTRRVAATVDVDGPVLHAALSPARPTQPLELALNLEGAFLGLFSAGGPVGAEERERLAERLTAGARPHQLLTAPPGFVDRTRSGYDEARLDELLSPVLAFLGETLATEPT